MKRTNYRNAFVVRVFVHSLHVCKIDNFPGGYGSDYSWYTHTRPRKHEDHHNRIAVSLINL